MKLRDLLGEFRYSAWEAKDTFRHRRRQAAQKRRNNTASQPSPLSLLIKDFTRSHASLGEKLRIRRAATPYRRAWRQWLRNSEKRERLYGTRSRATTQPPMGRK